MFVLELPPDVESPRTIDAVLTLARRGLTMLRAKRAVEAVLEKGKTFVFLPTVENPVALTSELTRAGFVAARVDGFDRIDVRQLRQRLGLSREQFAMRYGLEVESLRNWETGRRSPDKVALSYLRAISNSPAEVEKAYAATPELSQP